MGGESGSSTPGFCNSDFPKLANNATTVANAAILTKRSINATNLSFGRAGGSGRVLALKTLFAGPDVPPRTSEVLMSKCRRIAVA
jgi:hypothetical protein